MDSTKNMFGGEITLFPEFEEVKKGATMPTPDFFEEWQDYHNREIYINFDITEDIIDSIGYRLSKWNKEDKGIIEKNRRPIKIFINTDGGDLNATMHVCDLMKMSKTPIYTICQGKAYSAGGLILIAGHKRFCYPSSTYLLHDGSGGVGGNMSAVFDTIAFQKKYEEKVKDFVVSNTEFTNEEYDKNYRVQLYLTSEDMVKFGVVDEILTEIM